MLGHDIFAIEVIRNQLIDLRNMVEIIMRLYAFSFGCRGYRREGLPSPSKFCMGTGRLLLLDHAITAEPEVVLPTSLFPLRHKVCGGDQSTAGQRLRPSRLPGGDRLVIMPFECLASHT